MKKLLLLLLVCIAGCSTGPDLAGGGGSSETTNGVSAAIYTSDGTPATGATVRLRRSDYVLSLPSAGLGKSSIIGADALTDTNGRFEIRGIDPGLYMIEVNNGSTGVVLTCSLSVNDTLRDFGRDTLRPFGVINAVVDTAGQKAGHLYAQVFGLERLVALDAAGSVIMNDIPVGFYSVRVISSIDNTTLIKRDSIPVVSDDTTSLPMTGWRFSKRLYINTTASGANVVANVYSFPLLVRLDRSNFDFSQARDSGQDIRFTKSDNAPLSYEIEQWDNVEKNAAIWVKLDTIHGNNDQQYITMYWGASASIAPISLSDGAAVFDTAKGFAGVWQLSDQDPLTRVEDQTNRVSNGIARGTWTPANLQAGIAGGALLFNGVDNAIEMANTPPRLGTGNATISMWLMTTDASTQPLVSFQNDLYRLRVAMENRIWFGLLPKNTWLQSPTQSPHTTPTLADGRWHCVSVAYERSSYARLFVDGRCMDSLNIASAGSVNMAADSMVIGYDNFIPGYYTGVIDDVRYETTIRPAAWQKLCYENQRPDQTLVTFK